MEHASEIQGNKPAFYVDSVLLDYILVELSAHKTVCDLF